MYSKPIITEITIAKNRLSALLGKSLVFKLVENKEHFDENMGSEVYKFDGTIKIDASSLITQFKTIIFETDVEYKDILNYTLAVVESSCERIFHNYSLVKHDDQSEENLVKAILQIVDFSFFIYSVSPRVNTTIKLCRVLATSLFFVKKQITNRDLKHRIFKLIYDNVIFTMEKNRISEIAQVETLFLLLILVELGREYRLDTNTLMKYFSIEKNENGSFVKHGESLNYFSITVLLFYLSGKVRYNDFSMFIEREILNKFIGKKSLIWKNSELTLLLIDTLSCPYVSEGTKRKLLEIYSIPEIERQKGLIEYFSMNELGFTRWRKFDLHKELDAKQSVEVY